MSSAESFKACPQAQAGRRDAGRLGRIDPARLPDPVPRHIDLSLQVPSHRAGHAGTENPGDMRNAGPVWLPPRPRSAAPGGLAGEHEENPQDL